LGSTLGSFLIFISPRGDNDWIESLYSFFENPHEICEALY
jgi:hypothetical protein